MVDMNKELLHDGYRLHLVFDEMVQDIRKDPDNWIMIIEKILTKFPPPIVKLNWTLDKK